MTLRYVSPSGATPAGYDAYYTTLKAALAASVSGDEVVLEKSTSHTYGGGSQNLSNRSVIIRNESGDLDLEGCVVRLVNDDNLNLLGTAGESRVHIRGITFAGTSDALAVYTGTSQTNKGFLSMIAATAGMTLEVVGARFAYMDVSNNTDVLGGAFCLSPGGVTSLNNRVVFSQVEVDHLYGKAAIADADVRRTWRIASVDFVGEDMHFHDCGVSGSKVGGGSISFGATSTQNTSVTFRRTKFERIYSLVTDGLAADGGAFYAYNSSSTVSCNTYLFDCEFRDSDAQKGGGFWVGYNASVYMRGGGFYDNFASSSAYDYGGGASGRGGLVDNALLGWSVFDGVTFLRNRTAGPGGALRNVDTNGRMIVRNCNFQGNVGAAGSGDIWLATHTGVFAAELPIIENNAFLDPGVRVFVDANASCGAVRNNWTQSADGLSVMDAAVSGNIFGGSSGLDEGFFPGPGSLLLRRGVHSGGYRIDAAGRLRRNPPTIGALEG